MGPKKKNTRQASKLLVSPCELPVADLPTLQEVLGKCTTEKSKVASNSNIEAVLPGVVNSLKDLYKTVNSNLVVVHDKLISRRIKAKYDEMKYLNRSKSANKAQANFEKGLGEVFDIIVCQCKIVNCFDSGCTGCKFDAHILCTCLKDVKIPKTELSYVLDQRSRSGGAKGNFQIKGKDKKVMEEMDQTSQRKDQEVASAVKSKKREQEWAKKVESVQTENEAQTDFDDDLVSDDDFIVFEKPPENRNKMKLRNLAKECDRWGVSNRAGAAIANAALIDAGIITPQDQTCVIDKSKLRRALVSYRKERQAEDHKILEEKQGIAYYFDGKKTLSLCVEEDEQGKKYNTHRELELISVSSEPGGFYVSHLEPEGGKGQQVAAAVLGYLAEHNLADSWQIVGGDSTAANTGKHIGAFASLEKKLNRKLLWVLCMLHLNELPLRHVFVNLDGPTSSNNTFKGVIGKILPRVEDLDWNDKFEKVQVGPGLSELSEEVASDLSSDQRMLFLAFVSIWNGQTRIELYSLSPGPISHSRWLTLCLRILILYMKSHRLKGKNKANLLTLVQFLMSNYVPMWFACKQHTRITDGPKHLFNQIKLTKVLKDPVLSIVRENISQNAYWAHPEVLLLAMLADKDTVTRSKAVDRVLLLRGDSDHGDDQPRLYHVPLLKFTAKSYPDMIDWKAEDIYEPVLTVKMSREELLGLKKEPLALPRYPSNTQSVERLVKQTSRAASSVAGFEARDGFLRASATSRELLPKFESKKDFQNNFV